MLLQNHEPGSTFKLVDLMAILEDKVADTSTIYDTNGGEIRYSGKSKDSHKGATENIIGQGFELSSNTVMVRAVYENYKDNPSKFVNHVNSYGFNKKLNMDFKGRKAFIPQPSDKSWSNISLPWMAFGWSFRYTNADFGIL
jgi:cell division protein FtsI (penicillin-binding protein 3)